MECKKCKHWWECKKCESVKSCKECRESNECKYCKNWKSCKKCRESKHCKKCKNFNKSTEWKNGKECEDCRDCQHCRDCLEYRGCQFHRCWSSKTSQLVQALGPLEKIDACFGKRLIFFKFAKGGEITVECGSNSFVSHKSSPIFWQKITKLWTLEKLENTMREKLFFEKQLFSSFFNKK